MAWSIETALACGLRTIVNTDSEKYAEIAREWGAEVVYVPPEEAKERGIHQDTSSMYDVLKSEIPRIGPLPEIVLLLQATTPFRNVEDIKRMIGEFDPNTHDSLVAVERVPEKWNPAQVFVNGRMADGRPIRERITRRQDFPDAFTPTGSAYLFKASNLTKGSIYGDRVMMFETSSTVNINSEEDFCEAQTLYENN